MKTELKVEDNKDRKQKRGYNLLISGIIILGLSFVFAILSEGFGFNRPNFKFHGVYSILGIVMAFSLPYGWIGLLLFWKGKKLLPKKKSYDVIFFISLYSVILGIVLIVKTMLINFNRLK